jgi:hypothetical protein
MYTTIDRCRICSSRILEPILELGIQSLTGVFPKETSEKITAGPLELVRCSAQGSCGLVQLRQSYDPKEMYGHNYGYRSSLNASMVAHLQGIVDELGKRAPLQKGDLVIDIGSNDSTLLQRYPKGPELLGVDPTGAKFKEYYPKGIGLVADFFSAEAVRGAVGARKAKAITSIAMLYDLEQPLAFFEEVREVLDDEGLWVFEQSYMPSMLEMNAYDTVCHEHLEYYGLSQIRHMTERTGFKIVDVALNGSNGGSFRVTVAKAASRHREDGKAIERILQQEGTAGLTTPRPYEAFRSRVFRHRDEIVELLSDLREKGARVLGYGASTKGNVILQFCGITPELLPAIAEVNADKFGRVTPGTGIPIISEEEAHLMHPDRLLVLPWHFRDGIVAREASYLQDGGKLIFPLPAIEVIGG